MSDLGFEERMVTVMTGAGFVSGLVDADPYWMDAIVGAAFMLIVSLTALWLVSEQ